MSEFEFDPGDGSLPELPELDRIDTQDAAGEVPQRQAVVRIDHDLCEATGVCAAVCPEDVLEHARGHTKVVRPEACTECWICVENCVSGAIEIS